MVSKCANPACTASFRYLRQGRLFLVESAPGLAAEALDVELGRQSRRLEYFWLCHACCRSLNIVMENGSVKLVEKSGRARPRWQSGAEGCAY
jgi:hypothetical protein